MNKLLTFTKVFGVFFIPLALSLVIVAITYIGYQEYYQSHADTNCTLSANWIWTCSHFSAKVPDAVSTQISTGTSSSTFTNVNMNYISSDKPSILAAYPGDTTSLMHSYNIQVQVTPNKNNLYAFTSGKGDTLGIIIYRLRKGMTGPYWGSPAATTDNTIAIGQINGDFNKPGVYTVAGNGNDFYQQAVDANGTTFYGKKSDGSPADWEQYLCNDKSFSVDYHNITAITLTCQFSPKDEGFYEFQVVSKDEYEAADPSKTGYCDNGYCGQIVNFLTRVVANTNTTLLACSNAQICSIGFDKCNVQLPPGTGPQICVAKNPPPRTTVTPSVAVSGTTTITQTIAPTGTKTPTPTTYPDTYKGKFTLQGGKIVTSAQDASSNRIFDVRYGITNTGTSIMHVTPHITLDTKEGYVYTAGLLCNTNTAFDATIAPSALTSYAYDKPSFDIAAGKSCVLAINVKFADNSFAAHVAQTLLYRIDNSSNINQEDFTSVVESIPQPVLGTGGGNGGSSSSTCLFSQYSDAPKTFTMTSTNGLTADTNDMCIPHGEVSCQALYPNGSNTWDPNLKQCTRRQCTIQEMHSLQCNMHQATCSISSNGKPFCVSDLYGHLAISAKLATQQSDIDATGNVTFQYTFVNNSSQTTYTSPTISLDPKLKFNSAGLECGKVVKLYSFAKDSFSIDPGVTCYLGVNVSILSANTPLYVYGSANYRVGLNPTVVGVPLPALWVDRHVATPPPLSSSIQLQVESVSVTATSATQANAVITVKNVGQSNISVIAGNINVYLNQPQDSPINENGYFTYIAGVAGKLVDIDIAKITNGVSAFKFSGTNVFTMTPGQEGVLHGIIGSLSTSITDAAEGSKLCVGYNATPYLIDKNFNTSVGARSNSMQACASLSTSKPPTKPNPTPGACSALDLAQCVAQDGGGYTYTCKNISGKDQCVVVQTPAPVKPTTPPAKCSPADVKMCQKYGESCKVVNGQDQCSN